MPTVTAEYILDHLFRRVMLEIHIDIRRLIAFAGQEAFDSRLPDFAGFGFR